MSNLSLVPNCVFEPVKTFNFRFALDTSISEELSEYFGLSVESAYVDLTYKSGKVVVREFGDCQTHGLNLMKLYLSNGIKKVQVELLSCTGEVVRCYHLNGFDITQLVVSCTKNGVPGNVKNGIEFKFDSVDVETKDNSALPPAIRWLTLDYTSYTGVAERA